MNKKLFSPKRNFYSINIFSERKKYLAMQSACDCSGSPARRKHIKIVATRRRPEEATAVHNFCVFASWLKRKAHTTKNGAEAAKRRLNPKQAAYSPKRYSYTFFDALGRIAEVGEVATSSTVTPTGTVVASDANFQSWVTASGNTRYEVTQSYYDELTNQPYTYTVNGFNQNSNFQRNRVNAITYEKVYNALSGAYDAASYYQYDVHGNAERVLKDVSELASLGQNLKQTVYDYELISGNVNKVIYQPGQADQFIHTYDYDADNRLVHTLTSHQGLIYHQDEKQFYYLHGPTARTEIGEHKVQGQDYIYTIHGWLKGVNASVLDRRKDAGRDGKRESLCVNGETYTDQYSPNNTGKDLHSRIGADAFGFALSYYNTPAGQGNPGNRDYISIKGNLDPEPDNYFTTASTLNLYNGNIKQMSVALMKGNSMTGVNTGTVTPNMPYAGVKMELLQWQYTYDQLQRLTNATALTGTSTSTYTGHNDVNEYKNTFTYDENGNIKTQLRNGNSANLNLDNLTYNYLTNALGGATNQLGSVTENLAQSNNANYGDDYDNITCRSVTSSYDEIGNLKTDARHYITEIKWNVYGKVTEVLKDRTVKYDDKNGNCTKDGTEPNIVLSDIEYRYNEMGMRIVKIVKPHLANSITNLSDQDDWTYTYYAYDPQGNVMGVYTRDFTKPAGTPQKYDDVLKLTEHHIYGSSRIGISKYENKEVAKVNYTYVSTTNNIFSGSNGTASNYSLDVSKESRTLGTRLYELSNHLGNVLVVVSDKKIPVFESVTVCTNTVTPYANTFTHYTADVQSATDYSPFGAPLTGRSFSSNIYRYGMNGQEKENEIFGEGNAMSAEFWMYDARLGRRWNVDPVFYPWQSGYATFNNNPNFFNDPLGLEGGEPDKYTGPDEETPGVEGQGTYDNNVQLAEVEITAQKPNTSESWQKYAETIDPNEYNAAVQIVYDDKMKSYNDPTGLNVLAYGKDEFGNVKVPQAIKDQQLSAAKKEVMNAIKDDWAKEECDCNPFFNRIEYKMARAGAVSDSDDGYELVFETGQDAFFAWSLRFGLRSGAGPQQSRILLRKALRDVWYKRLIIKLKNIKFEDLQTLVKKDSKALDAFFKSKGKILAPKEALLRYRELATRMINGTGGAYQKVTEAAAKLHGERIEMINEALKKLLLE